MSVFGVQRAPGQIYFGVGQRHALPAIAKAFGKRVFICSDERFKTTDALAAMADALRASGLEVGLYDQTIAELPISCVREAAKAAIEFHPNVIVGIGGGSCLDIAKLVALICRHGDDLPSMYGELKVPGPTVPVIAVPTTSGTGSEVTPVAVLGDPQHVVKIGISSPFLIPAVAVCDPELTLTCPPRLTAIAGADALTHAIEAFTAIRRTADPELAQLTVFVGKNALSDFSAMAAIRALYFNLRKAVEDGTNIAAREQVMLGSLLAGLAFGSAGTAAAHALQYPIGALTSTAHGLGVAALMPFVMDFNQNECIAEFAEIARELQLSPWEDHVGLADAAIDAVAKLFADIGIPRSIADLGVKEENLEWISKQSMLAARLVNNNPRQLDVASIRQIVDAAFAGNRQSRTNSRERS
jgi:alcohol dehydrogenase class IV